MNNKKGKTKMNRETINDLIERLWKVQESLAEIEAILADAVPDDQA